jgi:hypothetical protein
MADTVALHPRATSGLRAWLHSDLPVARWIFLIILLVCIVIPDLVLDGLEPRLVGILIISLLVLLCWFFFGFGLLRPANRVSRSRLYIPVSACALLLTVLAAAVLVSVAEASNSFELPRIATPWILLYGSWLYGELDLLDYGPRSQLTNTLFGMAESAILVFIVTWLLVTFAAGHAASRFRLATRLSWMMLAASVLALAITIPSHIIEMRRGDFLAGIATVPCLRGASLSLLFALWALLILVFLRPLYRRHAAALSPWCLHCGYDLRASPQRCPECGRAVAPSA